MPLLFVYGSLKEGFPNFGFNAGRRIEGRFVTAEPHPLMLLDGRLPCLLPAPGEGLPVSGQLFEVDDAALAAMDRLERVGEPGGYRRQQIRVLPMNGAGGAGRAGGAGGAGVAGGGITAFVYMQDPALLRRPGEHVGPLAEYTLEHAARLSW